MEISKEQVDTLTALSVDFSLSHGLITRTNKNLITHAPVALFPSPFPKECFKEAYLLQPLFNTLVDNISQDSVFITESLEKVSENDEFTKNLLFIHKTIQNTPLSTRQPIRLGLYRSDYMLDIPPQNSNETHASIKQIELNTISSSFSSLSAQTTLLHQYMYPKYSPKNILPNTINLPPNDSMTSLAKGIAKAHELYNAPDANVLMVVQPLETNIFDQRFIEYELFDKFKIKLIRASLSDVFKNGNIEKTSNKLYYKNIHVSVVYFRAGYTPNDYPTRNEWDARLLIEQSFAVKCPTIEYHLVGTKKIQQILSNPGILEKFIKNQNQLEKIKNCFTGLYPLDESSEGLKAYEMALSQPDDFVMKPQREGGGNNIYGEDIKEALKKLTPKERNAYILMKLIRPPKLYNYMIRNEVVGNFEVVSELGVYGVWVSDGSVVHLNEAGGHLLRTKTSSSHEGGVAAGYAVLDSPYLI